MGARSVLGLVTFLALACGAVPARGDVPAEPAPRAAPKDTPAVVEEEPALAEVTGDRVNLRVGPRLDSHPVAALERGTVVEIVEEVPGWVGVRVPQGFPVAVSMDYVVPEGANGLRVMARRLNLRVSPPERGAPPPGIFRDHPALGEVLTLIDVADPPPPEADEGPGPLPEPRPFGGRWAWVVAPEGVRAYLSDDLVRRLERSPDALARVAAERTRRGDDAKRLAQARAMLAAKDAAARLMETVGEIQQDLYHLRQVGGNDKAPIVDLANRLDAELQKEGDASSPVLRLALALRSDLEREIELRVARNDAELAKAMGREPNGVPALEKVMDPFEAVGLLRYEPTPGWKEDGVFFLWLEGKPAYALRLTVGGTCPI